MYSYMFYRVHISQLCIRLTLSIGHLLYYLALFIKVIIESFVLLAFLDIASFGNLVSDWPDIHHFNSQAILFRISLLFCKYLYVYVAGYDRYMYVHHVYMCCYGSKSIYSYTYQVSTSINHIFASNRLAIEYSM